MTLQPGGAVPPGGQAPGGPGPRGAVPAAWTATDADPVPPGEPDGDDVTEPCGLRDPVAFTAEIRAALRYEAGLAVKAAVVLVVLAVLLVLRAMYLSLPGGRCRPG